MSQPTPLTLPSGKVVLLRQPGGLDAFLFFGGLKRFRGAGQKDDSPGSSKGMMGPGRQYEEEPDATGEPDDDVREAMFAQAQRVCDLVVEPKLTLKYPAPPGLTYINDFFRTAADYGAVCNAVNDAFEEAEGLVGPLSATRKRSGSSTRSASAGSRRRRRGSRN